MACRLDPGFELEHPVVVVFDDRGRGSQIRAIAGKHRGADRKLSMTASTRTTNVYQPSFFFGTSEDIAADRAPKNKTRH